MSNLTSAAGRLGAAGRAGAAAGRKHARAFGALGNPTRLALLTMLAADGERSIAQLTADTRHSRQAISKHLRALQAAGIVRSKRAGRETRFEFDPRPLDALKQYLELVSARWDHALERLKRTLESGS